MNTLRVKIRLRFAAYASRALRLTFNECRAYDAVMVKKGEDMKEEE
jgi:hypothetical protein